MTAIVTSNGKTVRSTTLTAEQSRQFQLLAECARNAQALLRSGNHPHTIYDALSRLEEMLDPTFKARMAAIPRDYIGGGIELFHVDLPTPAQHAGMRAIRPDGDYRALAYSLGMTLASPEHFDHAKDDATGAWVRHAS